MPTDFTGITTTGTREYDAASISAINEKLKARNYSKEDRAAILGTIIEESGGDPFAKSKSGAYQGLLQWGADRYRPKSSKKDQELNNQVQYILDTIDNTKGGINWTHGGDHSGYNTGQEAHDAFRNSDDFAGKVRAFSYGYVRPAGKEASSKNRVKTGGQVLDRLVVDEVLSKPKPKVEKWQPMPFTAPKVYKSKSKFSYADGGSLDDNYWDYLPLKEKAEMMRVAINNGITTLPEIREAYNKFAKGGKMNGWTMEDEAGYRYWRSRLPKNLRDTDDRIYDMRGAYKAGMQPMWNEEDKSYHLQSRDPKSGRIFKSPLHSTYLKALMEDASMGYYPIVDNKGNTYTKTWPGNTLYEKEEPEVPFKAYGGNLFGDGGDTRQPSNSERAMSYLMSRGMSNTGAAAIVGTLQAESGLNPAIHAKMKGDDGEGLAQWTGSRKKVFWNTLETIEPGAQKRYGSIVNVPLERQLDVILAERPTVTAAIHNAKDINTATDIMLRGYENGGGAAHNLATVNQMNNIYGKWNNGYDNQMKVRLGNANKLLGLEIDPSTYQISQDFFDDINAQISNLPEVQLPDEMATDPTLRYNVPTIDETLLRQPKEEPTPVEQVYDPRQERLERLQNFNTIMGMMGAETPLTGLVGSGSSGLFDAIGKIYS